MRRFIPLILVFVLVFATFVPCFAATVDVSPVLLPSSSPIFDDVLNSPFYIDITGVGEYHYSASNSSSVYFVILPQLSSESRYRTLAISNLPNQSLHIIRSNNPGVVTVEPLTNYYNGYYYTGGNFEITSTNVPISSYTDLHAFLDDFFATYSVSFSLGDMVSGSVSWLSTVAYAVKSSSLLLFMVIFSFIGIGIGLFRRFLNHG